MDFETSEKIRLIQEIKSLVLPLSLIKMAFGSNEHETKYSDNELQQKSAIELKKIYNGLKIEREELAKRTQESKEKNMFYNRPNAIANFSYWSKQAYWTIHEGIVLMLGKEPNTITIQKLKECDDNSPFLTSYKQIKALADRYVTTKQLTDPVTPANFLIWARETGLNLPTELTEMATIFFNNTTDWERKYHESLDSIKIKDQTILELNKKVEQMSNKLNARTERGFNNMVASLLNFIAGSPFSKKHPDFINESQLIKTLAHQYKGHEGMSESNLSRKFPAAKESLSKQ